VKKKPARRNSRFGKTTAQELAEATAKYGRKMVIEQFEPLTDEARRRWARARHKRGRPRRGKAAKVISVSVEKGLLSRSDDLAKDLGLTRAGLIERGLKAVLAVEGKISSDADHLAPARRRPSSGG
jgi:hypothetical protein